MNIITSTVFRNNLANSLKAVATFINLDLFEDLLALTNKEYLKSIKNSRKEFEEGAVFTHDEAFGTQ